MDGLDTSRLDELKTRVKNKLEATEMYRFKGTVSKLLGLTVEVKLITPFSLPLLIKAFSPIQSAQQTVFPRYK